MARKIVVNLDTSKEIYTIFKSKQNDDLILEVNVFENGEGLDLTNKEITIQALKADNTYVIQNTDIKKLDKKFEANLVRDFTRVPGATKIEVVLVESGKQNTTFSFYLEVVGSVIRGAVESADGITALEKVQEAVTEIGKINEETEELIQNSGAASKEEINKVNTQLAEKLNKNGIVTMANMGQDVKEAMTGGSVAVVGENTILEENIVDGQVTEEKTSFIIVDKSLNLFDKSKSVVGFYSGNVGEMISLNSNNTAFNCYKLKVEPNTTYICTGLSYAHFFTDKHGKILSKGGSSTGSIDKVSFTTISDTKYVYISFRNTTYPIDNFMICKGDELPLNYIPFYTNKTLSENIKVNITPTNEKVYTVGVGKDFETITQAIRSLKNDTTKKTILIDSGTYDIFKEMGGESYFATIDTSKTWQEVNDIVPPNTKLIAIGRAYLNFTPTSTQITREVSALISPLNFIEDAWLENVTVIADNCRYAIHDESGGYLNGIGKKHYYKNVLLNKKVTNYGIASAFGCGFIGNNNFEFDSCIFKCSDRPLSIHNSGYLKTNDKTDILIKNCALITNKNASGRALNLRNTNGNQSHVTVNVINSYLDAPLVIQNETETERPNAFDLTVIGGTVSTITVQNKTNIYPPVKY